MANFSLWFYIFTYFNIHLQDVDIAGEARVHYKSLITLLEMNHRFELL